MVIGIMSARNHRYHPNRRLIEAAAKQGHRVSLIQPENCLFGIHGGRASLRTPSRGKRPDVVLPRIGANISAYSLTMARHFELLSIPVVNRFDAILLARNKFLCLQALVDQGIPVPNSHYVTNSKSFDRAVERLGGYPVVVKTPKSRQGEGVALIESRATAGFILHNLANLRDGLVVQEFLAPAGRRDVRVFVIGGDVVGAMELKPRDGDFRSNIHLSGQGNAVTLDKELERLALASTRALGLEISGTDIMVKEGRPMVVEVNYSPGFRGLEASTGIDVASRIILYAAAKGGES